MVVNGARFVVANTKYVVADGKEAENASNERDEAPKERWGRVMGNCRKPIFCGSYSNKHPNLLIDPSLNVGNWIPIADLIETVHLPPSQLGLDG